MSLIFCFFFFSKKSAFGGFFIFLMFFSDFCVFVSFRILKEILPLFCFTCGSFSNLFFLDLFLLAFLFTFDFLVFFVAFFLFIFLRSLFLFAFLFIFYFSFFFVGEEGGRAACVTLGRDTDQSFRVCKVNLATRKVATKIHDPQQSANLRHTLGRRGSPMGTSLRSTRLALTALGPERPQHLEVHHASPRQRRLNTRG